jgi:hypothetical protein
MAQPDRVLPRSSRAGHAQLQARRRAGIGFAEISRNTAALRGNGLERDIKAMAIVARMLRQGAQRWLRALAGTP